MIRYLLAVLSLGVLLFVSCSKDDDDKLEGKWQLQQVETDGQIIKVDTVYYNFQTSLFLYQIYIPATDGMRHCYGFKTWDGDKQLLLELEGGNSFLPYTDWKEVTESFTVETLTNSKMILNRENKRYVFRKF
ncbi:lipocalin-like domain-containing protein [Massilibacteroides sp.]|uniref:lipocalin-like domain-containing protein n=1 Tax=Massilibacteroides sp. TaxID=2034766 RepID=UPI0026356BD2|nr:lipocalin-like domain-containing protein [Massilibacteroides sp.]MDD4514254.1 lipocalin-like domain-containing protein [Massilibacteroides sp.]